MFLYSLRDEASPRFYFFFYFNYIKHDNKYTIRIKIFASLSFAFHLTAVVTCTRL